MTTFEKFKDWARWFDWEDFLFKLIMAFLALCVVAYCVVAVIAWREFQKQPQTHTKIIFVEKCQDQ